jgi:hypothetical protein
MTKKKNIKAAKPSIEELRALPEPLPKEEKSKKKKWENPHKREYGIEIVRRENEPIVEDIVYKLSIDIGFATSGLTFFNRYTKEVKSIYYKKDKECHVKGAGIVYLSRLCEETWQKYKELIPREMKMNRGLSQFILEEPLVIAGQRSFSISLYVLLHYLIDKLLYEFKCHSVILVRPGSAKKLLNWGRSHMPDSEKTKWVKENLPEWGTKNNHTADSNFSMILTNYEELSQLYPNVKLLNKVEYKVYESYL